jgi:uncharacterized protein YndB with AHSA1/START domain
MTHGAPLHEVTITRTFRAPRDLVWQAWTDPRLLAQWFGPKGYTNPVCDVDVRPGGRLEIHMQAPDGTVYPSVGTYLEVDPPRRLVFTSGAFALEDGSHALEDHTTVTFEERHGATQITLYARVTRVEPEDHEALSGMEQGWSETLDKLDAFLASSDTAWATPDTTPKGPAL